MPGEIEVQAGVRIRLYEPRDREAVREVCRATAYGGDPAALVDPRMFTDLMIRAWTDFAAGPLWVAERDGRAQGYLAGCLDMDRFTRIQARRVAPAAVARALARGLVFRPALWRMLRGFPRFLAASRGGPETDGFPAELHIDLLPPVRGRAVGTRLVELFLETAAGEGVPGVHAVVHEENGKARRFFERLGFRPLGRRPAFRPPPSGAAHPGWKIVYVREV